MNADVNDIPEVGVLLVASVSTAKRRKKQR